jgi:hypothetical protein
MYYLHKYKNFFRNFGFEFLGGGGGGRGVQQFRKLFSGWGEITENL